MSNLAKIEFLSHFWQYGSVTYFGLGQKTKSDFFSQNNHFLFTKQLFLMAGKIGCISNPKNCEKAYFSGEKGVASPLGLKMLSNMASK